MCLRRTALALEVDNHCQRGPGQHAMFAVEAPLLSINYTLGPILTASAKLRCVRTQCGALAVVVAVARTRTGGLARRNLCWPLVATASSVRHGGRRHRRPRLGDVVVLVHFGGFGPLSVGCGGARKAVRRLRRFMAGSRPSAVGLLSSRATGRSQTRQSVWQRSAIQCRSM